MFSNLNETICSYYKLLIWHCLIKNESCEFVAQPNLKVDAESVSLKQARRLHAKLVLITPYR